MITLTSSSGCDSIVTTNLTVNDVLSSTTNPRICEGQNYLLPDGSSANTTGTYVITLTGSNGCDSIITTNLIVHPIVTVTLNSQICQGENYILPDGTIVTANGTYTTTLTSGTGCDSIVTVHLTVHPLYNTSLSASTCVNQAFSLPWGGTGIAGANSHRYTSESGCDSTVTINLTINPVYNTSLSASTCVNHPFNLPWGGIGVAGVNSHLYSSVQGCDSIVTINLAMNPAYNTDLQIARYKLLLPQKRKY